MNKIIYTERDKYLVTDENNIQLDIFVANSDIDNIASDFTKYIETQKIDGMSIEDFFIYDDIPLYYYERPSIYMNLKSLFFKFEIIRNVIEQYGNEIEIETDDDMMSLLSKNIFNLKVTKVCKDQQKSKNNILKIYLNYFLRMLVGFRNCIKMMYLDKSKENVCVISYAVNINITKFHDKSILYDTQIGPLVDELKKKCNIFNLQYLNNTSILNKTLKYKVDYIPFEFFIFYKKLVKNKVFNIKLLKNNLNLLLKIEYKYKDYNLKEVFIQSIFNELESKYYGDLSEILAWERFLKHKKVKKCIVTDEGDRMRCIITAGNRLSIETYAVQHGILNEFSHEYLINTKYNHLVPQKTFVWGEKYKRMLLENTNIYNDYNVEVAGQVRTDSIFAYYEIENNRNNKIKILYATQFLKDLLEPATETLFKALTLLNSDYELVIKLHPIDIYYNYYENMIKKYNITNVKIIKDGDIYELINWCDVVISVHSTVVVEGVLLNKPSICIVLPKYNDAGGFIRDGISIGVETSFELKEVIDNISHNNYLNGEKVKNYIKENFNKVDGKVVERIMKNIWRSK